MDRLVGVDDGVAEIVTVVIEDGLGLIGQWHSLLQGVGRRVVLGVREDLHDVLVPGDHPVSQLVGVEDRLIVEGLSSPGFGHAPTGAGMAYRLRPEGGDP